MLTYALLTYADYAAVCSHGNRVGVLQKQQQQQQQLSTIAWQFIQTLPEEMNVSITDFQVHADVCAGQC
jgi:hypothetical protein